MNYIVHRDDASQSLQYCNDGLQNIIDQCISGGNYWGGEWSLNGFKYSISNSIFDQTPITLWHLETQEVHPHLCPRRRPLLRRRMPRS